MVLVAALDFGGVCQQQRVQQIGGAAAVGWQQVIKHLPLTTAYANKAITVVWGILLGFLLFGESITLRQFIGAAVIIVGIVLFVRADNEEEGGQ